MAIAKSFLESGNLDLRMAEDWFNWVWETQEKEPIPRSQGDIDQSQDTLYAEIKKLASGAEIRAAMDKLGYTEKGLLDCDAGKLAEIRDKIKDSMLV